MKICKALNIIVYLGVSYKFVISGLFEFIIEYKITYQTPSSFKSLVLNVGLAH